MARREVMQAVELVEHDVAADEPPADEAPSGRRPSRRWRLVLGSGIAVDGTLLGLDTAANGAQSLVAVDEQTGARTWATPLSEAHTIDRGTDGFSPVGGCLAEPGTGRAACLV